MNLGNGTALACRGWMETDFKLCVILCLMRDCDGIWRALTCSKSNLVSRIGSYKGEESNHSMNCMGELLYQEGSR